MNALAEESSPYLRQHADNPVAWLPWGEAAFAKARAEDKPILLSVGYAACHWCHVMAHESFENDAIAARINRDFVPVKVDREERPDLDQIYQSALALTGQQGGWPLTMALTPDGAPFWGGTYFPPERRWGRAGFPDVLEGLAQAWRERRDAVTQNAAGLGEALAALNQAAPDVGGIGPERVASAAARLLKMVDTEQGGLRGAPKFPQVPLFTLLWNQHLDGAGDAYAQAVTTTLTALCEGGIYDHLAGGFARYSTDEMWLVPHFEKMLYDNAQLLSLLTLVWQRTGTPLYQQRIRETIGWLLREMVAAEDKGGGGFAATLDADSEGEEGRFTVWTLAEIEAVLGAADAAIFARAYDVTAQGNWEHRTILHRNHPDAADVPESPKLAAMRAKLLTRRGTRVRPGWDDKVLADWNGMAIAALAEAGFVFGEAGWIDDAAHAFAFVAGTMGVGDRLHHAWRAGRLGPVGMLDDYAHMARAALLLHEVTGDAAYLDAARRWVATLDAHFGDGVAGGYYLTADDAERLLVRTRNAADNPTPSGNGTMLEVLARLWHLTGEEDYRARAQALVRGFAGELQRNLFPLSTLLAATAWLDRTAQIVVAGPAEARAALLEPVRRAGLATRLLIQLEPGTTLPASHPASGIAPPSDGAVAHVCVGTSCSLPVTTPRALASLLAKHAGPVARPD